VPATGEKGFIHGDGIRGGKIDPPHKVVLTKPFCMDATEVTVEAYDQCVKADKCDKPRLWGLWRNYPTLRKHPVNKVSWKQGKAYCESRGQSLPTEAQWEWAATGGDGRKWAWGNDKPTCEHTDYTQAILRGPSSDDGCHEGGTSEVGTHPKGDKIWPDGRIHDLSGNVWEWCLDNYKPWKGVPEIDPLHLKYPEGVHVVRGGGWNRSARGIRTHYRGGAVVDYQVPGLGFRCVRNP
jgi:formylglycine-generating enzyme required for sulfatase activity